MEKIKPIKSKSSILSLKFQRKSDYTKFLKFIQVETKKLKGIAEPKENKLKDILKVGGVGLLGLGLFNLVGKGKDAVNKIKGSQGDFQIPFAIGRVKDDNVKLKNKIDIGKETLKKRVITKKFSPNIPEKVNVSKSKIDTDKMFENKSSVKNEKKTKLSKKEQNKLQNESRRNNKSTTTTEVGGNTTRKSKSTTATIDKNQGKQGPTGGTRDRIRGGNQNQTPEGYRPLSETDKIADRAQQYQMRKQTLDDIKKVEKQLERARIPKTKERLTERLNVLRKRLEDLSPKSTVKPNILKRFMNFYNKGRNVRFPDENNAKLIDLIKDDLSQVTYSDSAFKSGKKGFFNLRPLKAFLDPKMRATGPTPIQRQLIERPFRSLFRTGASGLKFLKNNPLTNALSTLSKSKSTKTGLFLIDALFSGLEFYDLFVRPGDNTFTKLYDLYVSINNAYFYNNPEELKYFITESKGSNKLFGFGPGLTNEQIRKHEIEKNLKIKRLKEAGRRGGRGGDITTIIPFENKRKSTAANSGMVPFIKDTSGNIVLPTFEPLNIGDDILLRKLNQ